MSSLSQSTAMRARAAALAGLMAFGALAARTADADPAAWSPEPPPRLIEDRLRLELGVFFGQVSTQLRLDPTTTVPGSDFSAERDLGLAKSKVLPDFELTLLPGSRNLLRLSALPLRRHAETTLDRSLLVQNSPFNQGEIVDTDIDVNLYGVTYGYRIVRRESAELAATVGLQVADMSAEIVSRNTAVREQKNGIVPIPLFGLEGRWDFTRRWSAEGRVQYITAHASDINGSVLDARLAATWRANPHLLIGLGYRDFRIDIDSQSSGAPGRLTFNLKGPQLYLRASL